MTTPVYLLPLKEKQLNIVNILTNNRLAQICCTTGFGKGFVMFKDILRRIDNNENVIAIASHRLSLNTQHAIDLVKELKQYDKLDNVKIVYVGSDKVNFKKYDIGIGVNVRSTSAVNREVNKFLSRGNQVVVITTYHSMNLLKDLSIDTIYCDEAHTLASVEDQSRFEDNYKMINAKNNYFLTATPKDVEDGITGIFTQNNEEIFGPRFGYTYDQLRRDGYVTKINWHIVYPEELGMSSDMNFYSIKNQVKIIIETFKKHKEIIKSDSAQPDDIEPKLLIKADSVKNMWDLYNALIQLNIGIKICAGASSDERGDRESYQIDGVEYKKDKYVETLSNLSDTEEAIVIHVDTLSEGINVPGFTGIMFLTRNTPSEFKIFQNIGRAMRLCKIDRKRWINDEISADDYSKWVKPNTYVILPMLNTETSERTNKIRKMLTLFRDYSTEIHNIFVQIGNDFSIVVKDKTDTLFVENLKLKEGVNEINSVVHDIEQTKLDNMNSHNLFEMMLKK